MSHSLTQIEEAEKKSAKIKSDAEKKAHKVIIAAEEKSHEFAKKQKDSLSKKQKDALLKHKETCAKKLEKSEKEMTSDLLASQKKWESNAKKGADFLAQAFQKHFS